MPSHPRRRRSAAKNCRDGHDLVVAPNETTLFQYLVCRRCYRVFKDYNFDGKIEPVI